MKKKAKKPFLKRSNPVMIRFDDDELKEFNLLAKGAELSRAEYGRRRILARPIAKVE